VGAKAKPPSSKVSQTTRGVKPSATDPLAWKSIFIQAEAAHTGAIANIHRGIEDVNGGRIPFDFYHLVPQLKALLKEHPDRNLFVFGGTAESFQLYSMENAQIKAGIHPVPNINVILMPKGFQPPPLVAVRDFQNGTEVIKPMRALNHFWNSMPSWASGELHGRVSILHCNKRTTKAAFKAQLESELFELEYSSLYFMRPSVDWVTEPNDDSKLSVRQAMFDYLADGEVISEQFDRDDDSMKTFVPDFINRFDLGDGHEEPIKAAIKAAFKTARETNQAKKDLFDGYDPEVLESVKVVKLYPKNPFVKEEHKSSRVNDYYGRADRVV